MHASGPRVAVLGFHLESNAFAPVSVEADFRAQCWEAGDRISTLARQVSHLPSELPGFYERMDALGPWQPLPLIVIGAPPGGPASASVWDTFLREVRERLQAVLPVDAVYIANHGASTAEGEDDTEAVLATMVRRMVGPDVPIVATHDLHANVSAATVEALDALIAYRTNPHVDQRERAAEAADLLREMLAGMKTATAYIRLPLTPPSVTLGTAAGPYADLIQQAEACMAPAGQGPIANVSVLGGFVFSDIPKCGLTINVAARGDLAAARRTALALARAAWDDRHRYVPDMIEVDRAVALARASTVPLLFADVADNPGGGGRGNTAWLLEAFHQANLPGTVLGVFVDPDLAAQAHALGEGASFEAVFNRQESEFSRRFQARAKILKLTDGEGTGRRGIMRGRKFALGPSALLQLEGSGLRVIVGSLRRQLAEPRIVEMHGIDIATVKNLIVKSRGHYRAGFDEFFSPDRIHDVDSPGLTTPNLKRVDFRHLPRPVWPIDTDVSWQEPEWAGQVD
ncbi:MlrC family protein 3 [Bordetella genomosp. 8]|uniref:Microcystinase C n=1 Tax=Bordetella genomosp. 8 TaxID=1416806 RepID=A0A1W6YQT0_9BORD|nr:M81 family metallopeptidase [Bordetella genomosp. 8]ARP83456.1 MlrC family protein 3 [Bordetella genomosp. 8]